MDKSIFVKQKKTIVEKVHKLRRQEEEHSQK